MSELCPWLQYLHLHSWAFCITDWTGQKILLKGQHLVTWFFSAELVALLGKTLSKRFMLECQRQTMMFQAYYTLYFFRIQPPTAPSFQIAV